MFFSFFTSCEVLCPDFFTGCRGTNPTLERSLQSGKDRDVLGVLQRGSKFSLAYPREIEQNTLKSKIIKSEEKRHKTPPTQKHTTEHETKSRNQIAQGVLHTPPVGNLTHLRMGRKDGGRDQACLQSHNLSRAIFARLPKELRTRFRGFLCRIRRLRILHRNPRKRVRSS